MMGKAIWIVGEAPGASWARIIELTIVGKMCGHNQDSIEIC